MSRKSVKNVRKKAKGKIKAMARNSQACGNVIQSYNGEQENKQFIVAKASNFLRTWPANIRNITQN
jgi:hypothetical protein